MKLALIIIDMQKDFFKREELLKQKEILTTNINELTNEFRDHNQPVIWVKQVWKPDLSNAHLGNKKSGEKIVIEGTEGAELLNELDFKDNDYTVVKTKYSGFYNTNLSKMLADLNLNKLVVCGINTHACVRMTVIDAYQRDFEVIVAKDCVGSYWKEHHDISMQYFSPTIAMVKSNKEIIELISN
jgi:nicotinamidase-related amidase